MLRKYRTGDLELIRGINLSTVMRCLHEGAPLSRARMADLTGLNKTTVSSLAEELVSRGLIRRVGMDNATSGRPATLFDINPDAGCIIGVAMGVDFVSAVLTDFIGQVLWQSRQETDPTASQEDILGLTLGLVDAAVLASESIEPKARILGVGLATPGTVDVENGLLIFSPNQQWRQVNFRGIINEHIQTPVIVDNDANAAAMAEHLFGVARNIQDFIFIFSGVGVGGGLFLNGELYRGSGGFAGEIGHTNFRVETYQAPCRCGNRGCWEVSTNQGSVLQRVRARLDAGRSSIVSKYMKDQESDLTLPMIVEAAHAGDGECIEALTETGELMGLGIANLINIFNPKRVVLGGALSLAGEYLLPPIERAVEQTALLEIYTQADIVLSAFGPDASVMGAAALVVEAILSNPTQAQRLSVGDPD